MILLPMDSTNVRRALCVFGCVLAVGQTLVGEAARAQSAVVTTVEPARRDFALRSTQPGTAEAFHEADLGAKVSGEVTELLVDIGTRVRAGQVLARIAVPELMQARNAVIAEVAALESEHARIAMLVERNSMTRAALTESQSRLDMARAGQAEVEAELGYATIKAPFAGVVTARTIDPGDMVYEASSPKGGDQPLLRVARLDVIRVKTFLPERAAAWVDIGDTATVSFDAIVGMEFSGAVSRIAGVLDPGTRTMLVEIDLDNASGRIRPGYFGETRILLESRSQALAVPAAALRLDGGNAAVFVVAADGTVRQAGVAVGVIDGDWAEITGGLTGTERIVTGAAVRQLRDGAPVTVALP
jgi:RND family efflux transporter MFP subunit